MGINYKVSYLAGQQHIWLRLLFLTFSVSELKIPGLSDSFLSFLVHGRLHWGAVSEVQQESSWIINNLGGGKGTERGHGPASHQCSSCCLLHNDLAR